jgi:hypothetical protein
MTKKGTKKLAKERNRKRQEILKNRGAKLE